MEVLFCSGNLSDGLYLVNPTVLEILNSEIIDKSLKSKRYLPKSISKLWHLRVGHNNLKRIDRLVESGVLLSFEVEPISICQSCLEGIMTKTPFPSKGNMTQGLLDNAPGTDRDHIPDGCTRYVTTVCCGREKKHDSFRDDQDQ